MRILALFLLLTACGRTPSSTGTDSVGDPVYYDAFRSGDATTDQATGAPGSHSTLVAYSGSVGDVDFTKNIAAPALQAGASLYFSLGECYSGGFLDDLTALGGTQSLLSSARHTETASYGFPAPSGVDVDYTDAFITALGDGHVEAEATARMTAALDPFGPNPDAARINETMGSEHQQYAAVGGGENLRPADHAQDGLAVLWAGLPAERDGVQMNLMIDRLIAMGFNPERIWLLYGSGELAADHAIIQTKVKGRAEPIHVAEASRDNLVQAFAQPSKFVFFYVGDHGGLDGESVAKNGFTPDPLLIWN